ncbi:MAG: rhodanese-like domain-containing protein [Myxococcaceae bacterium]
MPVSQMTVEELEPLLRLSPAERPALLDVRGHDEHAHVAFPGSVLIPLHELEQRVDELDAFAGKPVVVYCHHGIRSLQGAAFLTSLGLNAVSLQGGIDAYAVRVDRTMARY